MMQTLRNLSADVVAADAAGRSRVSVEQLLALRLLAPRLRSTRRARAASSGGHLSHLHARGVDYAESRVYQPGDDIRAMDWRVTARSGRAHTKLFREERERSLFVLIDCNRSMRFGTRVRFKSVQAARAAALAGWMAVRAGDRVGALAFGRECASLAARGGTRAALSLIGALQRWDAAADVTGESLASALQRCQRLVPPGARVLILSDGFSCDDEARPLLLHVRQRAEVMALLVADPLEIAPPPAGVYGVEHEGRRHTLPLLSGRERKDFAAQLGHGRECLTELCRRAGVPLREVDTRDETLSALRDLLDGGGRR